MVRFNHTAHSLVPILVDGGRSESSITWWPESSLQLMQYVIFMEGDHGSGSEITAGICYPHGHGGDEHREWPLVSHRVALQIVCVPVVQNSHSLSSPQIRILEQHQLQCQPYEELAS